MPIPIRRAAYAGAVVLAALALGRAAQFRFQQTENDFRKASQEQLQKLGITRGAAKAKYPTPEIHMVTSGCLTPGGSGEVSVKGKFVPEGKIIFANDNVEVVKESLTAGEYRATVKIAPDIGPQTADVIAIAPVTGITTRNTGGLAIGGRYEWDLQAANGWSVVVKSPANQPCGGKGGAEGYAVEFYRAGEKTPFEKRDARLDFSVFEGVTRFAMSGDQMPGAPDYQTLMKRMMDPGISDAEREKLSKEMVKAQEQMVAYAKRMTDPAFLKSVEEQKKKFGCERMEVRGAAGKLTGELRCAEGVGTRIALTGTMKFLGR